MISPMFFETPNVSVIIPTYNRLTMLEEALASLFAQTYKGIVEVIVIDDNSNDRTSEVLCEKYPSIELIALSQNGGPSAARNKGICASKGKYIAFLDSDDLWEKEYLKNQVDSLEHYLGDSQKFFSISGLCVWETSKNSKSYRSQEPHRNYLSPLHHLLSAGSFIHTPSSVVVPRDAFDEVGLFDESLRYAEDTDLYTRLLTAGYQPIFIKKPLAIRRMHGKDQAVEFKNIDLRIRNRLEAAKKYYSLVQPDAKTIPIQKINAEIYASFATQCYCSNHYYKWLQLSLTSMRYDYWWSTLARMFKDIRYSTKKSLKHLLS